LEIAGQARKDIVNIVLSLCSLWLDDEYLLPAKKAFGKESD
jgi:hypothetical protein